MNYSNQYSNPKTSFKDLTANIAFHLAQVTGKPLLSAFKRNDYAAVVFGYSSHSDLVFKQKSRSQSTKDPFLWVLADNPSLKKKFIDIFSNKIEYLDENTAGEIFNRIEKEEKLKVRILHKKSNYMINASSKDYQIITSLFLWDSNSSDEMRDCISNSVNDFIGDKAQEMKQQHTREVALREIVQWHPQAIIQI